MSTMQIDRLLDTMIKLGANDLHLTVGRPPTLRLHGSLRNLQTKVLDSESMVGLMKSITPEQKQQELAEEGGTDFGFAYGDKARFRVSVFRQRGDLAMVLRLIPNKLLTFDQIGLPDVCKDLIRRPRGLFLVTGPTGSGKTTTLYAALQKIDRATRNVMTIEDPVEYHLEGISQMQVNPKRDVTFAKGLRALLRQDPDVILVGEIRDQETAQLAIQASLTGHFVLATLHTNDAPGAIPRLIDIGLEPFLITSSLLGVLAQRLVRKICPVCSGTGFENSHTGDAKRCDSCLGTGYRGRLAVYEIMKMNDTLRRLTAQNADGVTLYEAAVDAGFRPMREDALDKVKRGLTDESEVYRVLH